MAIHYGDIMSNILLINGKQSFAHSQGQYNDTLHEAAHDHLTALGHNVRETVIEEGYGLKDEVKKFVWADIVILQVPGWWMGLPWTVKEYMDTVFTEGYGTLYANDGRSRSDSSRLYGSGGLLQGRQYMLSVTWNAPESAFDDPNDFFEGKGVDAVYLPVHKAYEFLGMTSLPTFMCNDVMKVPEPQRDVERYKAHLSSIFA